MACLIISILMTNLYGRPKKSFSTLLQSSFHDFSLFLLTPYSYILSYFLGCRLFFYTTFRSIPITPTYIGTFVSKRSFSSLNALIIRCPPMHIFLSSCYCFLNIQLDSSRYCLRSPDNVRVLRNLYNPLHDVYSCC